jgi:hypothetical protein
MLLLVQKSAKVLICLLFTQHFVANRADFTIQTVSNKETFLTATKKNGRIGWKSTHCTKPFDLLNGTCDRRFDN